VLTGTFNNYELFDVAETIIANKGVLKQRNKIAAQPV
jgi:hypothetical protein